MLRRKIMIVFILCALIFLGVLYNFIKNRRDRECRSIYGVFAFISLVALVLSFVRIIPEGAFDSLSGMAVKIFIAVIYISLLLAGLIFLAGNNRIGLKKTGVISAAAVLAFILPFGAELIPENNSSDTVPTEMQELYDRSYDAYMYAKDRFDEEFGDKNISKASYGFVPDDDMRYFVSFTYENDDGEEERYGYIISVDGGHNCTVLERGGFNKR